MLSLEEMTQMIKDLQSQLIEHKDKIEYLTEELKTCKKKINALIDEKNI